MITTILNAADDCLHNYINDKAFDHSLLMNILFNDHIYVDAAILFNSSRLERHVNRSRSNGKVSLFERACTLGLIAPLSYDGPVEKMTQIEQSLGLRYGPAYEFNRNSSVTQILINRALDTGLLVSSKYQPEAPKDNFAERYLAKLLSVLQRPLPPVAQNPQDTREGNAALNAIALWGETERWRFDIIQKAIVSTRKKNKPGIQRAEIFNHLGYDLGVPNRIITVGLDDILACAVEGTVKRQALEAFLRWVTQIHQLTRADIFEIEGNLPVHDVKEDFFIDSLPTHNESEFFAIPITLPPDEWLFTESVEALLAARRSCGETLMDNLRHFNANPSSDNKEILIEDVKTYERILCKNCPKPKLVVRDLVLETLSIVGAVAAPLIKLHSIPLVCDVAGVSEVLAAGNGVRSLIRGASSVKKYYKQHLQSKRQVVWHELTVPARAADFMSTKLP